MSSLDENWFVAERSEALAGILLTSRKDVRVRVVGTRDHVLDFLVEIDTDDPLSTQRFVVVVKGTMSSDPSHWNEIVERIFRGIGSPMTLPVCVFMVDVRDNKVFYAWVAEPEIESDRATLRLHETGTFHPLDPTTVSDLIDRVKAWYLALSHQLMPA